jgi:hypothetical protein
MTAHDEVQTRGVLRQSLVLFVSDVGDRCYAGNVGGRPNVVHSLLNCIDCVREDGILTWTADAGRRLSGNSNDGKLVLFEDMVGLDGLVEDLIVGMNIC